VFEPQSPTGTDMVTDRIKSFSALCARAETGASQSACYCVYTVAMTYWLVSLRRSLRIDISKSTDPIHVPFSAACRCICQLQGGLCCSPIARKLTEPRAIDQGENSQKKRVSIM